MVPVYPMLALRCLCYIVWLMWEVVPGKVFRYSDYIINTWMTEKETLSFHGILFGSHFE